MRIIIIGYSWNKTNQKYIEGDMSIFARAGVRKTFTDTVDLPPKERPGFTEMLEYVHTGDEVIVASLGEFGRDDSEWSAALDAICKCSASLNVLNFPSFATVHDASERWQLTCALRDMANYMQHRKRCTTSDKLPGHGDRGRKREYAPDSPNAAKRAIYREVLEMLTVHLPVTQIAQTVGINRKQIYRIKEYAQENGDLVAGL